MIVIIEELNRIKNYDSKSLDFIFKKYTYVHRTYTYVHRTYVHIHMYIEQTILES
jgi:hypothetical protein